MSAHFPPQLGNFNRGDFNKIKAFDSFNKRMPIMDPRIKVYTSSAGGNVPHHVEVLLSNNTSDAYWFLDSNASTPGRKLTIKKILDNTAISGVLSADPSFIDGKEDINLYVYNDFVTVISDGAEWHVIADGRKKHSFSAYRGTNENLATNWNKISIDTERNDIGGSYDHVTNHRFTPLVEGFHNFAGRFYTNNAVTNNLYGIAVYKNGSLSGGILGDLIQYNAATGYLTLEVNGQLYANGTTDYFELFSYNGNASALTLVGGINNNYFSGSRAT